MRTYRAIMEHRATKELVAVVIIPGGLADLVTAAVTIERTRADIEAALAGTSPYDMATTNRVAATIGEYQWFIRQEVSDVGGTS